MGGGPPQEFIGLEWGTMKFCTIGSLGFQMDLSLWHIDGCHGAWQYGRSELKEHHQNWVLGTWVTRIHELQQASAPTKKQALIVFSAQVPEEPHGALRN